MRKYLKLNKTNYFLFKQYWSCTDCKQKQEILIRTTLNNLNSNNGQKTSFKSDYILNKANELQQKQINDENQSNTTTSRRTLPNLNKTKQDSLDSYIDDFNSKNVIKQSATTLSKFRL